jgi:hypothetical protein
MCGKSITYVKFTNEAWSSFWHGGTDKDTIFELGTTDLPGEGGAGMPPGKPGTGGAGGSLTSTVSIDPSFRDLTGGPSAPRHPGTPGGAGGTPQTAYWVFFEGKPKGTGSDGAEHVFSYRTERKEASAGKASGAGPQADKPKGDNGQDISLSTQPTAKDKCAAGWITPLLLNIVIQHAKDVAAAEQPERARAVLKPYFDALAGRTNEAISSGLPEEVVGASSTMAQLRDEAARLATRFDQHLDSFGNPPGWVPNLTLTGAVGAYDAVRDIALKELYGAYFLEKAWKAKEARANALKQHRCPGREDSATQGADDRHAESNHATALRAAVGSYDCPFDYGGRSYRRVEVFGERVVRRHVPPGKVAFPGRANGRARNETQGDRETPESRGGQGHDGSAAMGGSAGRAQNLGRSP